LGYFEDNAYEAAVKAGVLEMPLLQSLKERSKRLNRCRRVRPEIRQALNGPNVKAGGSKMDYAEGVMEDIRQFRRGPKSRARR